jgi:hypothetical protein
MGCQSCMTSPWSSAAPATSSRNSPAQSRRQTTTTQTLATLADHGDVVERRLYPCTLHFN